jgi:hypothetical protein
LVVDTPAGELSTLLLGVSRIAGEPGPASAPTRTARRHVARAAGAVGLTRRGAWGPKRWRLSLSAGFGHEDDSLTDRFGELGIGRRVTDDRTSGVQARAAASADVADPIELSAVVSVRRDAHHPEDAFSAQAPSVRWTPSVAVEPRVHGRWGRTRWELRPSARLALTHGRIAAAAADGDGVVDFVPTFRLGAAVAPRGWIALSLSVATGRRLPSMLELFGDRGALDANPALQPERSLGGDAGVVVRGRSGPVRGAVELRGFYVAVDDLIRWRRTSQFTAVAENVAAARVSGLEGGLRGSLGRHLELSGALTWLSAEDGTGRVLPFRPALVAVARPEVHTGPVLDDVVEDAALRIEVTHTGASFVDAANLIELRARTWLGLGLRFDLLDGGLFVDLSVQDLADRRGDDLLGYPLPGRRFLVVVGHRVSDEMY